jgi:mannose-6-phosphate isomerase-like protein (cupin superfamily)
LYRHQGFKFIANMPSIQFVKKGKAEVLKVGPMQINVLEDGSHTDNRIGTVEIIIPPRTPGPPQHWHEMHDETFLTTKGTVRFTTNDTDVDAEVGDYVVVPPRAPHTFANATDEEAICICTCTPAYYVNYFRLLAKQAETGQPFSQELILNAMAKYATLPVTPDSKPAQD